MKAQGYEESQSKTKLVYDFKKKTDSPAPRDSSPYNKPDPLQYIRPQQNQYSPKSTKKQVPDKSNTVSEFCIMIDLDMNVFCMSAFDPIDLKKTNYFNFWKRQMIQLRWPVC